MAAPVARTFAEAARLCMRDPTRRGNCLSFSDALEIIYAGDVHGHRRNLTRIIAHADLAAHPGRRLVLQELIHGGPTDREGGDRSFEVLLRAARLKAAQPERVFFLMGNHDLAQFTGSEITKDGAGMCKAFDAGLDHSFGDQADEVRAAVHQFLRSLPLAGRCPNGVMLTHSLPAPRRMDLVDFAVLERPYQEEDFTRGGSVYEWTWGRGHTQEQLDDLSRRLGASHFFIGHQPVENGFELLHDRAVILASDDAHGAVMVFNPRDPVPDGNLSELVQPIATL